MKNSFTPQAPETRSRRLDSRERREMARIDPETRVERLRKANPKRERDKGFAARIPPGQFLREKFPVFTEGPTPKIDLGQWRLKISGLVENPFELAWEEFTALPGKTLTTDLHCVTR